MEKKDNIIEILEKMKTFEKLRQEEKARERKEYEESPAYQEDIKKCLEGKSYWWKRKCK